MAHISDTIKALRTAKRLTQSEFAERIGVTKSTVSAYENGTRLPSYDVLIRVTRVFHVTTDFLLGCGERDSLDVTGLTREQIESIQDIVATYQRHNLFYKRLYKEEYTSNALMEFWSEENT